MRALVVEDDPDLNRQLVTALEDADYVVDTATDGEEGCFLGETEPYDPELSPSFQVIAEAGKSVDVAAAIRTATAAGIESGENAGSLDS